MILFIDDDKRIMDSYRQELEMEFLSINQSVVYHDNVDDGLLEFYKPGNKIDLLILDIMMTPGVSVQGKNTLDGLRTGVFFYRKIRDDFPELQVIIFTNVSDPSVRKEFQGNPNCRFLDKQDVLPFELAEQVKEILSVSQN